MIKNRCVLLLTRIFLFYAFFIPIIGELKIILSFFLTFQAMYVFLQNSYFYGVFLSAHEVENNEQIRNALIVNTKCTDRSRNKESIVYWSKRQIMRALRKSDHRKEYSSRYINKIVINSCHVIHKVRLSVYFSAINVFITYLLYVYLSKTCWVIFMIECPYYKQSWTYVFH